MRSSRSTAAYFRDWANSAAKHRVRSLLLGAGGRGAGRVRAFAAGLAVKSEQRTAVSTATVAWPEQRHSSSTAIGRLAPVDV
jgi:hypothetical protein